MEVYVGMRLGTHLFLQERTASFVVTAAAARGAAVDVDAFRGKAWDYRRETAVASRRRARGQHNTCKKMNELHPAS